MSLLQGYLQGFSRMHNHMPKYFQRAGNMCDYYMPVFFIC